MTGYMATYKVKLKEVVQATPRIKLLKFERPEGFKFISGQFIMTSVEGFLGNHGETVKRSYSISSAPQDEHIEICVTLAEKPFFSEKLHSLKAGDEVIINGPFGIFNLKEPVPANTTFIAGGSGIAPIRSMLRGYLNQENTQTVHLFFGARSPGDFAYRDEIEVYGKSGKLKLYMTVNTPESGWDRDIGFVPALLPKYCNYPKGTVYVCGPPLMVNSTVQSLKDIGFEPSNIILEQW